MSAKDSVIYDFLNLTQSLKNDDGNEIRKALAQVINKYDDEGFVLRTLRSIDLNNEGLLNFGINFDATESLSSTSLNIFSEGNALSPEGKFKLNN